MAIGSNNKIQIELTLDSKGAIKSAKSLNEELQKTEKVGAKSVNNLTGSFSALKGAIAGIGLGLFVREVGSLAQQGARVQGLTNSFNDLQESAGALGSETLQKLRTATRGLVSDFELMQSANNAVLLGLPIEGFDKLAESATKLGLATNRTAKEALTDLVTGIGRGSKLILDNLGIIVDTTQAYEKYAQAIGVATDKLTEQQKKEAFQAEAYEQIKNKSKELSDVQLGAGNSVTKLGVAFSNLKDTIGLVLDQSTPLINFINNLSLGLNKLGDEVKIVANGFEVLSETYNQIRQGNITDAFDSAVKKINEQRQAVHVAKLEVDAYIKSLGDAKPEEKLKAVNKVLKKQKEEAKRVAERLAELPKQIKYLEKIAIRTTKIKVLDKLFGRNEAFEASEAIEKLRVVQDKLLEKQGALTASTEAYQKASKGLVKDLKGTGTGVKDNTDEVSDYDKAIKRLKSTLKAITVDSSAYDDRLEEITRQRKNNVITNEEYIASILKLKSKLKSTEEIEAFTQRVKDLDQQIRKAKTGVEQLFGQDTILSRAFSKGGAFEETGQAINEFFSEMGIESGDKFVDALGRSLTEGLRGRELSAELAGGLAEAFGMGAGVGESIAGIGKDTPSSIEGGATAIGGILGGMVGGAEGAKLGAQVGDFLGGIISMGFGQDKNAEANARGEFSKFITNVLDEKELQLVIDGQLQKLNFGITGGRNAFDPDAQGKTLADYAFAGMSADAVSAFTSIGVAMDALLNTGENLGSQFGAILADNVGNLNNLQILIGRLGLSAEEMGEAVKDAWLMGDLSAQEALVSLQKIQQVTTQGIPDGLGLTTQAFDNLTQSAGAGELVLDALGDLAVEAGEKGIGSLEALKQELIASGKDASKVNAAFDAIAQAGITSLEALKDVSVDTALQISASLEQAPDFFAERVAKLEEIQQKLNQIESKEVDIKFNFKSSVDRNTQEMREAGAFNSAGIESVGAEGVL